MGIYTIIITYAQGVRALNLRIIAYNIIREAIFVSQELVEMLVCPKCGQTKPADKRDRHMCVDCAKAENSRYSYLRVTQAQDWVAQAADAGLEIWLQQPGETQWEYTVWQCYRDSYPGKKPTYGDVAKQLGTTYTVVSKIARRWSFPTRMQAWITECDRITLAQRRNEILNMNAQHISMAQRLNEKLSSAIDCIVPESLKPSDIASLARISTDLERKARVDSIDQATLLSDINKDMDNPELKRSPTKGNDLTEVVQILLQAGALGNVTQIGVRETTETKTTREFVAKED